MPKVERVMFGFPWYAGPDVDTYYRNFEFIHYCGRLQERCYWLNEVGREYGVAEQRKYLEAIPRLDGQAHTEAEVTLDDDVVFEFYQANKGHTSLPGLNREYLAECAIAEGVDWLLMWDDDMLFDWSFFMKLWRHKKPVVAALAFTSRDPICPVIYRIKEERSHRGTEYVSSQVLDYPKNRLIGSEDIGGSLAFGAGVVLIHSSVFSQIPRPWFYSTGCGEDWMFCVRCHQCGIPRYVDTSVKTGHKRRKPEWHTEQRYLEYRESHPDEYKRFGAEVK